MDIDDKDASETSDDSSSGPEELSNKDAKEVAVASIKAEFASQRSLKEKGKKLKIQIELRNIEQKKIKEEKKKAEDDSSLPKPVESGLDDKATVVEETKSEKPEKNESKGQNMKFKKNKKRRNLRNSNNKRDSSIGVSKSDSIDKDAPKKLTGAARKKNRRPFNRPSNSGKVIKNKLVKNSANKTEKDTHHFKKFKPKAKNPKVNVVTDNKSTEKANGKKRKLQETKSDITKIKSIKTVKVKTEKAD